MDDKTWQSWLKTGTLVLHSNKQVSVKWDAEMVELRSHIAEKGRGVELSELVAFNGKLYTVDDRSGIGIPILLYMPRLELICYEVFRRVDCMKRCKGSHEKLWKVHEKTSSFLYSIMCSSNFFVHFFKLLAFMNATLHAMPVTKCHDQL